MRYWFSLDGASSGVELRLVGLLAGNELVLLVERVGQVVLRLGGGDFGRIWIRSLRQLSLTFSYRSLPNLSSTKLPTSTP